MLESSHAKLSPWGGHLSSCRHGGGGGGGDTCGCKLIATALPQLSRRIQCNLLEDCSASAA